MPDDSIPGPTPTGYQRTQGGGVKWVPPTAEHLSKLLPQYEIECILGYGGMGAVYKGKQKSLHRAVAIKILPPGLEDEDASYVDRFKNEARVMAKFTHPAIVAVYDFGETTEGQLYIVMEFVDGTDVQKMLSAQGRLPPEHALAITAHVCDALLYAHEHGVIHRDIKPANILINMEGAVKVADFGLAKAEEHGSSGLTKTGMAMGTPDYVAPEALVMGVNVDGRADLYAVGVMLYAMLTGNVPRGAFKPASVMIPGIDPRFDNIVQKAMQMDREERYQSAKEIRRDLDVILTTPLVQAGGQSSAAIPKQAVAQKPVAKGPQKPMGKSANVPVRQEAAVAAAPNHKSPIVNHKSKAPLFIGIAAVAVIAVGAFVMMGGKKDAGRADGPPSAASGSSSSTSPNAPIKVREEPKPSSSISASPSLPVSKSSSSTVSSSPAQFPPGKWVKVFTKFEDLPAALRGQGSGVKFEDGWILTGQGNAFEFKITDAAFQNVGIRARIRDGKTGSAGLGVRRTADAYYQVKYSTPSSVNPPFCALEVRNPSNANQSHTVLSHKGVTPSASGECRLELCVVGDRLSFRLDDKLLDVVNDKTVTRGQLNYYGNYPIRDIEVINLDGLSEAEALKILGVDEKGNDLRGALAQSSAGLQPAPAAPPPSASKSTQPAMADASAKASGDGLKPTTTFPPGQWVKVFTKFEDLPPELRKPDSGVKFEDGRISHSESKNYRIETPYSGRNVGIRARFLHDTPSVGGRLGVRVGAGESLGCYQLLYSQRDKACVVETIDRTKNATAWHVPARTLVPLDKNGEAMLEIVALENHIFYRMDGRLLGKVDASAVVSGKLQYYGSSPIRDIEVINLDGIPEAEALRIIGVDEKGNDLRALAAKQEQQKAEQSKVVDAMAAIPELKTLHEQFVKLQAERVTASFEADVAKLNTGYLGGLDREIEKEKKAGHLDGVIVLEAEKKLIQGVTQGVMASSHQASDDRRQDAATPCPIPAEDDDATPANLKGLHKIYRDAFAKLEATRAANLKQLTDPLSIRLKQLESTLTQANRIDHAKVVREYRENLGKGGSTDGSAGTPARNGTTGGAAATNEADDPPSKYSQREVAEWFLEIGAKVTIKAGSGSKAFLPGEKLPAGKIVILRITPGKAQGERWTFSDDDFARLSGLRELEELSFASCPNVTGSGIALMGNLPSLTQLEPNWPKVVPSNFGAMPAFPKLERLTIEPSYCPAADFEWVARQKQLTYFFAPGASFTDGHLAVVARCPKLANLRCSLARLTDEGLAVLEGARSLEELILHSNSGVTGAGLVHVKSLPKLKTLNTGGGPFEARNLSLIAQMKHVTKLFLDAHTIISETDECLRQLAALKNQIVELEIGYAKDLTDAQESSIRKVMPKTKVTVMK